jgi:hypothetical protein
MEQQLQMGLPIPIQDLTHSILSTIFENASQTIWLSMGS